MPRFRLPSPLLLVLTGLLLPGCRSYTADPLAPPDELAALRRVTLADLRLLPSAATRSDQTTFDLSNGLDEAELVAAALTLHPGLRAQRQELGEHQALLVQAGLWPNPELGVTARQGIVGPPATGVGADLLLALLRPDERPAREAAAQARLDQARAELAAEEFHVAATVRHARLELLAADQAVRQLEAEAQLRADAVALVRTQQRLGEASELALVQVELDQSAVARQLRAARTAQVQAQLALNQLLGLPPAYPLPLQGRGAPLLFAAAPDLDDAALEHRVLRRWDLRAREASYQEAEAELRLAVAHQFPGLHLGPSYEKDIEGSQGLGLGLSLELPLFDRNHAEIDRRTAARGRARADYVAALHARLAEAHAARAALQAARDQVDSDQRELLPLLERGDALFARARDRRDVTVFEWLAARSRALEARAALRDALLRHARAVIDLEAATGAPLTEPPTSHPTAVPETAR